ncbi:MAG TPA: hypothetical protein VGM82_23340 [Gemmatimonadaceae bacterium]
MFTIRCTQALLKRLHAPLDEAGEIEATTVLGDWYANTLNVGRRRLLLCSSERSLLTVIISAAPLASFPERLDHAVSRRLAELGIAGPAVERERREMRWHCFGRTRNRRVLGSMNDFGFLAEHYIRDDEPDFDLGRIEQMLNRAPCRPIQYQSPDRLTPMLFASDRAI